MGLFFAYIVKSTVCLTIFYLFYKLLLSKDTFHRFNRIALLSFILLSVGIPFIDITIQQTAIITPQMIDPEMLLYILERPIQPSTEISGLQILIILYLAGILFFSGRLIYSVSTIIKIIRSGESKRLEENITLIIVDNNTAPFSWMRYIVISRPDWENNKEVIIAHEIVHIRYRHSWDVLLTELCIVFHWFNPAAWLLKKELENIHEYEADESVINQGIDAKTYQLLLIKKAVGSKRFNSMANSFNHSKLKKRITMMLKRKSNSWARLKYLCVLPLAAITVVAFARPEISNELDKISSTKISELPFIKETLPAKNEPATPDASIVKNSGERQESVDAIIQKHLKEIHAALQEKKNEEKATIQEAVNKALAEIDIFGEPGKLNEEINKAIRESESRLEAFMAEKENKLNASVATSLAVNSRVSIIIDGEKASTKAYEELKPYQIKSLRYDVNKENARKYGEDMEGVIYIETNNK